MHTDEERINGLTEVIIGCAYTVGNKLGCGFLEKCYENALALELRRRGLEVKQQQPVPVLYDGEVIGDYYADLMVEGTVVVELKAGSGIDRRTLRSASIISRQLASRFVS